MTTSAHNSPISLDLTREEAWGAHAAVVAEIDRLLDADADPAEAVELLRSIEDGGPFEAAELDYLRDLLGRHVDADAPPLDRAVASDVIAEIEAKV